MNILILMAFLLVPGMTYGADVQMDCAYLTASPTAATLDTGLIQEIYVTVLDSAKMPVINHSISAVNRYPDLITIEPKEALTNDAGKVVFTLKGLACHDEAWCPLTLLFTCKDREISMLVD